MFHPLFPMKTKQNAIFPFVYYWNTKVSYPNTNQLRETEFAIPGTKNEYLLELRPCSDSKYQSALSLRQIRGESTLCIDLHVELKLSDETKNFCFENFKGLSCNFGTVGVYDLLGVTCTFSKGQNTKRLLQETDPNCRIIQGKIPEAVKQEVKIKEQVKSRGLDALSKDLKDLFINGKFSDLNIQVKDHNYPVHKAIILSRCPIFQEMLSSHENQDQISITDCELPTFSHFLSYLYSGQLDISSVENAFDLYNLSRKYLVNELETDCVNFILNKLTISEACKIFLFAKKYDSKKFIEQSTKFLVENARDILATSDWKDFLKNNPNEGNEIFMKMLEKASKN